MRDPAAGSIAKLLVGPGGVGVSFTVTREELEEITPQQQGEAAVIRRPSALPPQWLACSLSHTRSSPQEHGSTNADSTAAATTSVANQSQPFVRNFIYPSIQT